jgi:anti-sigma28 factor (negative regulator of flagellin synthesis)
MKINPNKINPIYQTKTSTAQSIKELNTVKNVDKVEVSHQSKQNRSLQGIKTELTQSINTTHSINRINELKEQIKNGKYEVKFNQVAEALIAFSETMNGDKHD